MLGKQEEMFGVGHKCSTFAIYQVLEFKVRALRPLVVHPEYLGTALLSCE